MNAIDELREFHRFLGESIDRGAELTLDEVIAQWRSHISNRPGLVCDTPLIPDPLGTDLIPDPTELILDPLGEDSFGRQLYISRESQAAYELEHFLEHGHD